LSLPIRRLTALAAVAFGLLAAPALAADYTVDPNHTQAEFTVTHLAISHVHGAIPVTGGAVTLGPGDLPTKITATLSVKDLDTKAPDRDKDLRSADWFDTDKYPTMTFVSTQISGTPQAFTVTGNLTFHGVTKPMTLTAKEEGRIADGRGRTHIGYSATGTIDRREWGLNWGRTTPGGALVAGNDVTISLNVEAVASQATAAH